MKEKNTHEIKRRSINGVMIAGFVQGISIIGGFILSIIMSTELFGIFSVVAATAAFLSYFSDIGLAAALIQKKEQITDNDLTTTFTIQQSLVVILVVISLLFSNWIGSLQGFSEEGVWLFRALVVSFFLSSLKTIPSVLLERDLKFKELAIPQIIEVLLFNVIIITLSFQGWGIEMFSIAVLIRSIGGVLCMFFIRPWKPRLFIDRISARHLISFGIPFQFNSILALIKDQLFIMFLPVILPFSQIGYIAWAKKWSEIPLRLIMDNVIRVTFPTYSRLQDDPDKLKKAIEKTTFFLMLAIIPMSVGMIFLVGPLVALIPLYEKWEPALLSFYFFVIATLVAAVSTPLINALNAIGKIKITLNFMIFWTLFTWTVAPLLVFFIGFEAIAITSAIMSLAVVAVIWIVKRYIQFDLYDQIMPSMACSVIMGIVLYMTRTMLTDSYFLLILYIGLGCVVYIGSLYLLYRKQVALELSYIVTIMRNRS